jgi:outer membrane protein assembly factor BamB
MTADEEVSHSGTHSAGDGETRADAAASGSSRRDFLKLGTAVTVSATAGCSRFAPTAAPRELDEPTSESFALPTRPDTIFMRDVERTGYWPEQPVPDDVEMVWSEPGINTGSHTAAKSSPLYYDGDVIVPGDTGTVHSFTPEGERNWEASLVPSTRGTHSTPAVVEDYVFTAGYDGAVYAFDADTGDQRWRTQVSDAIGSSPVYYDGVVYCATEFYTPSGGMVALDATTGAYIWEDNRMTNHAHSITGLDPDAGVFAAGCNDGSLYVWNLDTYDFLGRFETGDPIKGPVCMYEGTAIFGSWDGNVYAVDVATRSQQWAYDTAYKIMSGAAVHPDSDTVVIGHHGDALLGLDATKGDRKWYFDCEGWITGGVTVAGDTALVGSYDTTVFAVDVTTGKERWRFERPHGWVSCAPAVHDGNIYVTERAAFDTNESLEQSGYLYKLTGV